MRTRESTYCACADALNYKMADIDVYFIFHEDKTFLQIRNNIDVENIVANKHSVTNVSN